MGEQMIYRIKPIHYCHVLDTRTSITRVITGPLTFTRQDNETVVFGPAQMVIVGPYHYAHISNPVMRGKNNVPILDKHGNFKLRLGDYEIRTAHKDPLEPFPLYPGEKLVGEVTPLSRWQVSADSALRLRAVRDFSDGKVKRRAGEEWLFMGPGTFAPRVEVAVIATGRAYVLTPQSVIRVRAYQACLDWKGVARKTGEEWLVRDVGLYILRAAEEFVAKCTGITLTDKLAVHLRATRTFVDVFGIKRKAGEEWLVTRDDAEFLICDIFEEVVAQVQLTTLTSLQYCVVLDPFGPDGVHLLGQRQVRRGITSFFLRPGERLESGIQNVHVLSESEGLLLRAKEDFVQDGITHVPGDRWMVYGPRDYVPPVQLEIIEKRQAIPLDVSEGIYVRDIQSGKVRCVVGESYMLLPYEELWSKELPKAAEELLAQQNANTATRDKTRAVTVRMPQNTVMQIYDYKEKKARIAWGPELVMLGPDEQFSILSLSGDKPKRPHVVKSLWLMLGPDFMSDIVTVETSDHARLSLKLSYSWHFDVSRDDLRKVATIFQVPDFVGDACKAIASRIRTAVAATSFDVFHKSFAAIIPAAVFGFGNKEKRLVFNANHLIVSNVDIESLEPVDQRTRDSLQKSVQLAIEITTKSQEATAKHEAERLEQEARGRLERQKLSDESAAEKNRKVLKELQAVNAAVTTTGAATAEAKARAAAAEIEGHSSVLQASLRAEASTVAASAGLAQTEAAQHAEIEHIARVNSLEVNKAAVLTEIEAGKFKAIVDAIGASTIAAIARSGPEMQANLLRGLGLKSLLVVDGQSPINLFNTANGLIASPNQEDAATNVPKK